jgi:biotin carboxylase
MSITRFTGSAMPAASGTLLTTHLTEFADALETAAAAEPTAPTVAVVDGISSGALLAPKLRERGYDVVHIQSSKEWATPNTRSFRPEQYVAKLVHGGDPFHVRRESDSLASLAAELSKFAPAAVLPGAESGVILADHLSEALSLRTNGTRFSHARRNKGKMAQRLAEAGGRAARHIRATSADQVIQWVRQNKIQMPVFLKPETAGGTRGVCACFTEEQVRQVFATLHGKPNSYGIVDEAVFAQEFMDGPEYALNTVSSNGRHVVTGIWEYERHFVEGAATVYDWDRMLPFEGALQSRLVEYGFQVLQALGVQHGPAHLEIKDTPRGPTLVEMGARLVGSFLPRLESMATDRSSVDLSIDAFLHPETLAGLRPGYDLLRHALIVTLKCEGEAGQVTHEHLDAVQAMPGYAHHWFLEAGTPVKKTIDANGEIGEVWLVHADDAVVRRSKETLREWERAGHFVKS